MLYPILTGKFNQNILDNIETVSLVPSHTITYMHLFSLCILFIYIALVGKSLYSKMKMKEKNKSMNIYSLENGRLDKLL